MLSEPIYPYCGYVSVSWIKQWCQVAGLSDAEFSAMAKATVLANSDGLWRLGAGAGLTSVCLWRATMPRPSFQLRSRRHLCHSSHLGKGMNVWAKRCSGRGSEGIPHPKSHIHTSAAVACNNKTIKRHDGTWAEHELPTTQLWRHKGIFPPCYCHSLTQITFPYPWLWLLLKLLCISCYVSIRTLFVPLSLGMNGDEVPSDAQRTVSASLPKLTNL